MAVDFLAGDFVVPGGYVQINLAVGPGTAAIGERAVVLVGPKLAAATWTAGNKYEISSEQDVINGAGSGSPLHEMVREFLKGNRSSRLYAIPVAGTTGGTPVAATLGLTVTAVPTSGGWIDLYIKGEQIRYSFGTSDTPTTIATGLCALGNARTWLPVTFSNVAGVITVTAKLAGASQSGNIAVFTGVDSGKGVTWSAIRGLVGDTVVGADGTTTEAAGFTTVFNNLAADGTYYLVVSNPSTTVLAALNSHLATCAEPKVGLRKRGIVGLNGTAAASQALAVARNYERLHISCQNGSYYTNAAMAAMVASVIAYGELTDPTNVPIEFSDGAFNIMAAPIMSDWFTQTNINDMLTDGVIPIQSRASGGYIVDGVTSRSKDPSKTVDDFRALYQERISFCDYGAQQVLALSAKAFKGKKLQRDTTLSDGAVDLNQDYPAGVVKPQFIKDQLKGLIKSWESANLIQDAAQSIKSLSVEVSKVNTQRVNVRMDLKTISHVRQLAAVINEVSEG